MESIEKLTKTLATEQALLARISNRVDQANSSARHADHELGRGLAELKQDQIDAVLQEREAPNPDLRKRLAALQTAAAAKSAELEGAREAFRIQAAKVENITEQLAVREMESMQMRFEPARVKLWEAFAALETAAGAVRETLAEVGTASLAELFFPLADPGRASYESLRARDALIATFNSGISLVNSGALKNYDPKRHAPAA